MSWMEGAGDNGIMSQEHACTCCLIFPQRVLCSEFYSALSIYLCKSWDKCPQPHFSHANTETPTLLAWSFAQPLEITDLKRKSKHISSRPLILQIKHRGNKISHIHVTRERLLGSWEGKMTDIKVIFILEFSILATLALKPRLPGFLSTFFLLRHSSIKRIYTTPHVLKIFAY